MIEKSIQDILNASIGLFKAGEENLQSALSAVQTAFEDLKTKGASDSSEVAGKLREVLDNSIKNVQDVSTQVEDNMNKILEEARKSYDQIIEQAKQLIGDERIQDLNDRFEDLAAFVKEKSEEMNSIASNFAETVKEKAGDLVDSAKDMTGGSAGSSASSTQA
ncbi:MAG: YtxH domain-containing protein [Leptospiraceae bacterium]|nr:YtxH domain-containing protein [Leptospiraceae bacterium]